MGNDFLHKEDSRFKHTGDLKGLPVRLNGKPTSYLTRALYRKLLLKKVLKGLSEEDVDGLDVPFLCALGYILGRQVCWDEPLCKDETFTFPASWARYVGETGETYFQEQVMLWENEIHMEYDLPTPFHYGYCQKREHCGQCESENLPGVGKRTRLNDEDFELMLGEFPLNLYPATDKVPEMCSKRAMRRFKDGCEQVDGKRKIKRFKDGFEQVDECEEDDKSEPPPKKACIKPFFRGELKPGETLCIRLTQP